MVYGRGFCVAERGFRAFVCVFYEYDQEDAPHNAVFCAFERKDEPFVARVCASEAIVIACFDVFCYDCCVSSIALRESCCCWEIIA